MGIKIVYKVTTRESDRVTPETCDSEAELQEATFDCLQNEFKNCERFLVWVADKKRWTRVSKSTEKLKELLQDGTFLHVVEAGLPGSSLEQITDAVRKGIQAEKEPARAKGFSSVGSEEAGSILCALDLTQVEGNQLYPIELPAHCDTIEEFDYSPYPEEDKGTPHFLDYHKEQLKKFGVLFDKEDGFQLLDVHSKRTMYQFRAGAGGQLYRGKVDVCLTPFGVSLDSAGTQSRTLFEHKQDEESKQIFRDQHKEMFKDSEESTKEELPLSSHRGQAIACTIGAYAYNNYPALFDLTDGKLHNLLMIKGKELVKWKDLSPTQAYYKIAMYLKSDELLKKRALQLEEIPNELQPPMKKFHALRPASALKEQLDSVVPCLPQCERIGATYDLMQAWAGTAPFDLSPDILNMFG